jgi:hypothetical protein
MFVQVVSVAILRVHVKSSNAFRRHFLFGMESQTHDRLKLKKQDAADSPESL